MGVDEQPLSRWYHRGAVEARGLYRELHVAVNRAEAEFMQGATETLQAASTSNPKHVQWLLSRRFPELYGRRDNVEAKSPEDEAADTAALRDLLLDCLGKFLPDEPPAPEPEQTGGWTEWRTEADLKPHPERQGFAELLPGQKPSEPQKTSTPAAGSSAEANTEAEKMG
ncbi:hypothetical protein [Stigmatella aurantiaca]|uniref:hypothetical protein n=1 Tax=Stigmatella aurantiaca TaxID=41 RepID=UPI000AE955FE|nr:hypothetical protein [Stigmatella aurantiaca]